MVSAPQRLRGELETFLQKVLIQCVTLKSSEIQWRHLQQCRPDLEPPFFLELHEAWRR
jgi:hypothetical protein